MNKKILGLLIVFFLCSLTAYGVDTWNYGNATTTRDPLFIDMPDLIHQAEPVTVTVYVNDPVIKAEANAVVLEVSDKFFTTGKQIQRSNGGTLRAFIPYNKEGSVSVGYKDSSYPSADKPDVGQPIVYFYFYKVKNVAAGVDPRVNDPSSEYYGMSCDTESNPYFCPAKERCVVCSKIIGTVVKNYFLLPSSGSVKLPGDYVFVDQKEKDGGKSLSSFSFSHESSKVVLEAGSDGKPVSCSNLYSLSLSTSYYGMPADMKYLKDWQINHYKAAISEGRTTVKDASGPGGLFPGQAIEIITQDVTKEEEKREVDYFSVKYELIALMEPSESGSLGLSMERSGCALRGQGKGEIDKAIREAKAFAASYQILYEGSRPVNFKPVHEYNILKREMPSAISGKITDGHNNPLPYMTVSVEYGGISYDGRTDAGGNYAIAIPSLKIDRNDPGVGTLKLYLSYVRDGKNYFNVLDRLAENKLVYVEKNFSLETEMDKTQDFDYGTTSFTDMASSSNMNNLKHIGPMYGHLSEITDFALTQLKADIDYKLPVDVIFASASGTAYSRDTSTINIFFNDSGYGSSDRPDNREYHEFCHHILFSQWNGSGLRGPGDTNHGGYINTGTGDSYTEGFAEFCAMACSKYSGESKPDIYAGFGSLELNYKAWGHRGYDEELGVAGILWDLYDEKNDKGDTVSLPIGEMWNILKVRRPNFYEYYKAFKAAYPDKSDAIDQIFIEHGFFEDKNIGNGEWNGFEPFRDTDGDGRHDIGEPYVDYGVLNNTNMSYDAGETIGKATNYERENRSSIVKLRDSYVKASDPAVTKYKVKVHFPDASQGEDYEYSVDVKDGLVYVAPIPEDLGAEITVEPGTIAYSSDKPYKTTNKEFVEKYYAAKVGSGFVDVHDFEVKPTGVKEDPGISEEQTTEEQTKTDKENKEENNADVSVPLWAIGSGILLIGGGLFLVICVVVVLLLLKKKKK
ncbi:MAG: carboxypeptidase-like regulatory domain-containing protein [Candidatus Altiarchaeia archaeon]